jgi:hypothetical protein
MGPESILLSVQRGGSEGLYRFVCPECFGRVEKRADRKIVALLVSAGVDVSASEQTELELPARPVMTAEGGNDPEAPPFMIDDVIRFHFLLQDEDFVRRLTSGT